MSRGTLPRSLRIPDAVWQAALTKARAEGTTLTALVVDFLRRYADDDQQTCDGCDNPPHDGPCEY